MSAAHPTVQAAPGTRQLGAALSAIVLAITFAVLLAFSQLMGAKPQAAPAAGTTPVTHDHGWSSDSSNLPIGPARSGGSNGTRLAQ